MSRYFFHLLNDDDVPEEEGTEFPDLEAAQNLEAAQKHAWQEAVHMAAASITEHQRLNGEHRIDVEDEAGEVLFSVFFRDVVAETLQLRQLAP